MRRISREEEEEESWGEAWCGFQVKMWERGTEEKCYSGGLSSYFDAFWLWRLNKSRSIYQMRFFTS